jgi:fibronectin-binding autotransporter adhesin
MSLLYTCWHFIGRDISCAALRLRFSLLVFLFGAFSIVECSREANAATINLWHVGTGENWNTGQNWGTGSIPTLGEDAYFGTIASSASPASVTLNASQTAYGLTLDPGAGKAVHIDPGTGSGNTLSLLSTDTAPDGVNKFFTINAASGTGNQINVLIVLSAPTKGSFTAMINSLDASFAITGGVAESVATWGVRISGNSQGSVTYATTASSYSGDTTIANGGILRIDLNNAIPNGNNKGNVVLEGNGQLQFGKATSQTINGLNSNSSTSVVTNTVGDNGATLTVGNLSASGTFAGQITNPPGTGPFNLIKIGQGTQRLIGADSYRGTTTISSGTLLVDGTHTGAGNYTTGSSGTLGGTGTISLAGTSSVTLSTGTLAPGDNAPGVLNINGTLNMSSVGTLRVEIGGAFPANGLSFYDQVNMTSSTAAINASFAHIGVSLQNGFRPKPSDIFYILTRADSKAFGDQPFDAHPEGSTISLASGYFGRITYKANWKGSQATSTLTGGNDMAIYDVVPEPSSGVLLLLGLLLAGTTRSARDRRTGVITK